VVVRPLRTAEAQRYGLDPQAGVVVSWLDAKGPLAAVGFETGDVVLGVNGQPIDGVDTFVALVNSVPRDRRIALLALDHHSGRTGNVLVEVR